MKVSEVKSFDCCGAWSVVVDAREIERRVHVSGNECVQGLTDHGDNMIVIRPGAEPTQQAYTLFHELFHVIYGQVGGLRGPTGEDALDEDDVITQLSALLLDTLRKNGRLTAALLDNSEAVRYMKKSIKRK